MVANTSYSKPEGVNQLSIVLVKPQLAENIGMVARAMHNCGLNDLRLVNPMQDFISQKAIAASAGGSEILKVAKTYGNTEDAIADLHFVVATSARTRDTVKPVWHPRYAAMELVSRTSLAINCGIIFGREKSGLTNHDVGLSDVLLEVPLNPEYSSLNLSQAVLIISYEWFQAFKSYKLQTNKYRNSRLAHKKELNKLFTHLEYELDKCGFLRVSEKRPSMIRAIRAVLQRSSLTEQEVRTCHGIITELRYGRRGDVANRNDWSRQYSKAVKK